MPSKLINVIQTDITKEDKNYIQLWTVDGKLIVELEVKSS